MILDEGDADSEGLGGLTEMVRGRVRPPRDPRVTPFEGIFPMPFAFVIGLGMCRMGGSCMKGVARKS